MRGHAIEAAGAPCRARGALSISSVLPLGSRSPSGTRVSPRALPCAATASAPACRDDLVHLADHHPFRWQHAYSRSNSFAVSPPAPTTLSVAGNPGKATRPDGRQRPSMGYNEGLARWRAWGLNCWLPILTRTGHGPSGRDRSSQDALHYLDTKTTCMAEAPWRNEVTAFVPGPHQREQEVLIHQRPLVMGLSCDWPRPGAYRTEDFAGVPILIARQRGWLRVLGVPASRRQGGGLRRPAPSLPIMAGPTATTACCAGARSDVLSGVRAERPGLTRYPRRKCMVWVPTPPPNRSAQLDIEPWLEPRPRPAHWKLDTSSTIATCTTRR